MIDYHSLRAFADSWGLLFMALVFLILVGWTFRPGARDRHRSAAHMIFDEADTLDRERDNGRK